MAAAALGENGVALKKTMHRRIATLATAAASGEDCLSIVHENTPRTCIPGAHAL